jgi:DNA-binding SARP family transcriptional activator/transcriptional regulator with XRE-family HTH domain
MCAACESRLGRTISQQRREAGLSQRQLADAAGVSISAIRDLEQGLTARPRAVTLYRLARVISLDMLPSGCDLATLAEQPHIRLPPAGSAGQPEPGQIPPKRPTRRHGKSPLTATTGFHLQILGSMVVSRDGVGIVLSHSRMRLVLALLAASPGEVVSRGQISDALWGVAPPRNAPVMIQSYISGLRRILDAAHPAHSPDGLIVSVASGYRLNTAHCEFDLITFRRHVAEARTARSAGDLEACCRALEHGLALWRGDPLCDIEALDRHPVLTGLARQRDRAIIDYAEAACQLGWHDRPLQHLERLIEQAPFDERAVAYYMIALAGTGRHAEALQAFERIRRRLAADLGLSPGPELRAVHAQVLRQQVPAAGPRLRLAGYLPVCQLPAAVADFTGRSEEQAGLADLLGARGAPETSRVAVLTGMPGIGKTALALHVAHLISREYPDGQLWTQLSDNTGRPRDPAVVLAELLTTLGISASAIPRSVEERASLYRSLLARLRVLIVADDASSAGQVTPLLPGSGQSAMLITSQSETATTAGSHLFQLRELTTAQAMELLRRMVGNARIDAESEAAVRISQACFGLPLALRIIGMKLAARKFWRLSALAQHLAEGEALDDLAFGELSVRRSIATTYAVLDERTQHVFERLSLLGHEFTESAVAAAAGEFDGPVAAADLADKSFLIPMGTDATGSPVYRLHRFLRDFAAERLAAGRTPMLAAGPVLTGSRGRLGQGVG